MTQLLQSGLKPVASSSLGKPRGFLDLALSTSSRRQLYRMLF